jgi:ankyrin repeat protein
LDWRSIKADSSAFQLLRKFEKELDFNVKRDNGETFISMAANEDADALFEYLITKPNINIAGIFSEVWRRQMNGQNYQWLERLIATKGPEIPQAEILSRFALIDHADREAKLSPELLKTMKLAYPLVKTFDQLTNLVSDAYVAPLYIYIKHYSQDPIIETIYNRILKEDTTLPKNSRKIILYLFKASRYDVLDIYVSRGYDFTVAIEELRILVKVTELRNLEALQYLSSKGVSDKTDCKDTFWRCDKGNTAFGTALKMEWYEGADQLLTMQSDINKQDYARGHTLLTAVKENRLSTVEYLISRNIDINYPSVLTSAISQQADPIVWTLLRQQSVDPNKLGYDSTMNNRQTFPIIEAARFGRIDYVKLLLAFPKIEKSAKDSLGYRAIDWAATNGYEEIVQLLKN